MNRDDLRWLAAYLGLMVITVPFALLPPRLSSACGRLVGRILYHLLAKWRRVGMETIADRLPYLQTQPLWGGGTATADDIIRQVFVNIGILASEVGRLYWGMDRDLIDGVEFRGMEHFRAAHARGKGMICITAHSGNWELMAQSFGARVNPVAVVARNMKKGYFDQVLEKIRLRHGNRVIYRDNGVKEMLQLLKANGILGILPDQVVMPPHGIVADFLGRPAWTTVMPVKLAIKTGCALLPFFIHREDGRNIVTIHPEIVLRSEGSEEERIADGTGKMNEAIGRHILRYPTQWNWLYRRWKGLDSFPSPAGNERGE